MIRSSELAHRVGWTLLHSLWQGAAAAVALGVRGTGESQLMVRIRRLPGVSTHSHRGEHSVAACAVSTLLGIALIIGVFSKFASGSQPTHQPTAAELVRDVRASENWVHDVDSLWMRFEGKWTQSPQAIAKRLEEAPASLRDMDDPGLKPEGTSTLEIAFDKRRLRCLSNSHGIYESVHIWDGARTIRHGHWIRGPEGAYFLSKSPADAGDNIFTYLSWLRTQMHRFWWNSPDEKRDITPEVLAEAYPKTEDYELTGRQEYRGIDCYVLEQKRGCERWYVGVQDHLLHGKMDGRMPDEERELEVAVGIAAEQGKQIKTREDFRRWVATLDKAAQDGINQKLLRRMERPTIEQWLLDYKEVSPGRWFPMRQGDTSFAVHKGKYFAASQSELKAVDVKVNAILPDELFRIEIKEGAPVWDHTHEPWLKYNYKKNFTPQEWHAILDEAANREWKNRLDEAEIRERERLIKGGKEAPNKATAQPSTRPADTRTPIATLPAGVAPSAKIKVLSSAQDHAEGKFHWRVEPSGPLVLCFCCDMLEPSGRVSSSGRQSFGLPDARPVEIRGRRTVKAGGTVLRIEGFYPQEKVPALWDITMTAHFGEAGDGFARLGMREDLALLSDEYVPFAWGELTKQGRPVGTVFCTVRVVAPGCKSALDAPPAERLRVPGTR